MNKTVDNLIWKLELPYKMEYTVYKRTFGTETVFKNHKPTWIT
jgi:hypothetical protein